ncbi:MAG: cytochrome c [Phycisphaerae bacterium]|nr:cytochrome c [Phycisphaerae bacterium]
MIPRPLIYLTGVLACLLLVPPAVIARVRATPSAGRPIHIVYDMDMQSKFRPQSPNSLFEDGRAMRPIVPGTVAVGEAHLDTHRTEGVVQQSDGTVGWAATLPSGMTADTAFLRRGHERFDIYCSVCHGYAGFGDGMVNKRANELMNSASGVPDGTAWVVAKNLHEDLIVVQPIGQIYHSLTYGIRNMAGYASQIPVEDRWAIAAYVKALQLSQNARLQDVPVERRTGLVAGTPINVNAGNVDATPATAPATPPATPPAGGSAKP